MEHFSVQMIIVIVMRPRTATLKEYSYETENHIVDTDQTQASDEYLDLPKAEHLSSSKTILDI